MAQYDDNLARILMMFKSYNCNEETLLTKQQLSQILNQQAKTTLGRNFNAQIIKEIWGQAETNSRGESTMRTFAKILNNAINILESRIYKINNQEGGIPYYQEQLNLKNQSLRQLETQYEAGFLQNYEKINLERKNKVIIQNKIQELQQTQLEFQHDLQEIRSCIYARQVPITHIEASQVAEPIIPEPVEEIVYQRQSNSDLLGIFYITMGGILLELIVLTLKPSLLTILCYSLIIYWLFLGYYHKNFITYLIAALGASVLFDFIYAILDMANKVNTNRPASGGLSTVVAIFLFIEIGLRVIIVIKLWPFRILSEKQEYFVLFGKEIQLKLRAGKREHLQEKL